MHTCKLTLARRAVAIVAAACLPAVFVASTTSAGIQGSGFMRLAVQGPITDVDGGVTVNGVTYGTAHARVSVNGKPADRSALRRGQIVTISGSADDNGTTGTADEVSYVDNVSGVISSVNLAARSFTVLGQTVRMNEDTLTDGAALRVGTPVDVSGFPNSTGELIAARVDAGDSKKDAQVSGTVRALDANASTFMLNTLLVDYDKAKVDGVLTNGAIVIVESKGKGSDVELTAKRVKVADPLSESGMAADLEGLITSFASAAEFELNGQRVIASESTSYKLKGGPLGPDVLVNVTGRFDAGTLVADRIETLKK